jgi:hypothetical protein
MKFGSGRAIALLVVAGAMFAGLAHSALAQDSNSYLYIAHAASGRNVSSAANPEYPIDVSANGTCIAAGLSFGEIRGPFTIPAATVAFSISKANSETPCSEPAVFTSNTPMAAAVTYVGVVFLTSTNDIWGNLYPADLSPMAVGETRALVINATEQSLSATVTPDPRTDGTGGQFNVAPGAIGVAAPRNGVNYTSVYLGGTNTLEAGPVSIETLSRNVYVYIFAGSATNGSVQLLGPKIIRGVF